MLKLIKKIREQTGAGVIDVKNALEEAGGDEVKAIEIIKKRGLEKAGKKSCREANEGLIAHYVHSDGRVAALVKISCETDFVARNEEFQALAKDIAMQVVAMDPKTVSPKDIAKELIDDQKKFWNEELEKEKKPKDIMEKIMQGKEQKFRNENALLSQPFVKDQERTVEEVLKEKIATIGENIVIKEFIRMEL
jgi:elongation factor Ts